MSTDTEVDQDRAPEPMPRREDPVQAAPGNLTQESEEVEVPIAEAQLEARDTTAKAPEEEPVDVLDVLEPKAEPRTWKFGPNGELEFTQRPLGFLAKMQWFALVGEVLDKAMSGEGGVSINELLSTPGQRGVAPSLEDFRDADTFVRAIGKLLIHAPDFLIKSYCIWLDIPSGSMRQLASQIMQAPPEEGGLTDDQGLEIIEIFIDQNYDALADFFGGKVNALQRRVAARQKERTETKAKLKMRGA